MPSEGGHIYLCEPDFDDSAYEAVKAVLSSGQLGFGHKVEEFEEAFRWFSRKQYNVAFNSASSAAFALFAYLREIYGICDVYTPSIGFCSPAYAALHNGHNVVFVDVDDNLLFDYDSYLNAFDRREWAGNGADTRILMPVLYGGVSRIPRFKPHNEIVVLDSAHCITPSMQCDYSFFSFHPYKPICMGNGGILATDSQEVTDYLQSFRNFGRINIDNSYQVNRVGLNMYMNNYNAALGLSQLEHALNRIAARRANCVKLVTCLRDLRFTRHDILSSYYLATCFLEDGSRSSNEEFICEMANTTIHTAVHYPQLHKQPVFAKCAQYGLLNTERLGSTLLNLPIHSGLNEREMLLVADTVLGLSRRLEK